MTSTPATGLPGHAYTDPAGLKHELATIFASSWQLVAHVGQISQDGDFVTATLGDQSVVVLRSKGEVRAMYNVCQHRGHELLTANSGHVRQIACPYHAWTYDLDGHLTHSRGSGISGLTVPGLRVELMSGFVFVNEDLDAVPLDEYVPGVGDQLGALVQNADARMLTHTNSTVVECNWKLAVENYNECYHCPNVHRAFTTGVVAKDSYRIRSDGNCIRHTAVATTKPAYRVEDGDDNYGSFYIWPASSIQVYPGRVLNTFRWVPLSVDQTMLIRQWWFEGSTPSRAEQEIIDLDWDTTVAEDLLLLASVQRGMGSRGYRPSPLVIDPSGISDTTSENPVLHLHRLLRAGTEGRL